MSLQILKDGAVNHQSYGILQIGTGGTGSWLVQYLSRMIYAYESISERKFFYCLADGDQIEFNNLLRQGFLQRDIDQKKSTVLARRYGNAYGINLSAYEDYVEDEKTVEKLFDSMYTQAKTSFLPIIIGAVDNNSTRKVLHQVFQQWNDLVYIDVGNEAIWLPDKPQNEWTAEERKRVLKSGFSGQAIIGVRLDGKTVLEPVCGTYPDMLELEADDRLPTKSCGVVTVNYPQRLMTNITAATTAMMYLNNLFDTGEVITHVTNFNAQNGLMRPEYVD